MAGIDRMIPILPHLELPGIYSDTECFFAVIKFIEESFKWATNLESKLVLYVVSSFVSENEGILKEVLKEINSKHESRPNVLHSVKLYIPQKKEQMARELAKEYVKIESKPDSSFHCKWLAADIGQAQVMILLTSANIEWNNMKITAGRYLQKETLQTYSIDRSRFQRSFANLASSGYTSAVLPDLFNAGDCFSVLKHFLENNRENCSEIYAASAPEFDVKVLTDLLSEAKMRSGIEKIHIFHRNWIKDKTYKPDFTHLEKLFRQDQIFKHPTKKCHFFHCKWLACKVNPSCMKDQVKYMVITTSAVIADYHCEKESNRNLNWISDIITMNEKDFSERFLDKMVQVCSDGGVEELMRRLNL